MSRGLKNHNPGNIRQSATKYIGEVRPSQDKSFKQFSSMAYGYRAMFNPTSWAFPPSHLGIVQVNLTLRSVCRRLW